MTDPWLYATDSKLSGVGIDLVIQQQLLALAEGDIPLCLVARGRLDMPGIRNIRHPFPPTKLFSWLPSQDYYALNKRYFSRLGAYYLSRGRYAGAIAWSKTALHVFRAAERRGIPRLLNVGNLHRDYDTGAAPGKSAWPRISAEQYREEYQLADRIMVASDFAAQTFIAHGVPEQKMRVIYRGVDTKRFSPLERKPHSPFIVASCGLLGERKGTYELLRIWRELGIEDAELWLIGHLPPNEAATLKAIATPSVRFWGFRKDMPDLLRQAHLHVLLSRDEGFAKVLLEAAASGVANLCTREAGMPEGAPGTLFVNDRTNGEEIAHAIESLSRNPQKSALLGQEARRFVEGAFTWEHFRQRVRECLKEVECAA